MDVPSQALLCLFAVLAGFTDYSKRRENVIETLENVENFVKGIKEIMIADRQHGNPQVTASSVFPWIVRIATYSADVDIFDKFKLITLKCVHIHGIRKKSKRKKDKKEVADLIAKEKQAEKERDSPLSSFSAYVFFPFPVLIPIGSKKAGFTYFLYISLTFSTRN
ncbi:predicted protein [Nematostella vectensis]|uniref:Uncharacterized protein n=1 Tax=Nematostella vectensis TaxID=45351 RepID=A7RWH1_NEMVE|nr:predicted protein [Nematostella vectensis]|eukprot:XP_001636231.1 predicted protein [Nematostella vectensis]